MRTRIILAVLFWAFAQRAGCRTANEFYTFKEAKATSVFIAANNDLEKHGPNRAFQVGSSYWSSEGQHNDTDFVSWTGELYEKALISQINIFWEYAPKEVEISFSLTGDDFNVVMPFKPTFENKRSYKENFKLDAPAEARFVRLTLRGAINTYFGIRHVHLVGFGSPLFMLKSGISSTKGEMCLQLEGSSDNPRVVLDLCINAIASSDGRELWIQNSRQQIVSAASHPPKCLTTVDASKHGEVIVTDCNDDACTWEFMGNSQMSVKNANQLCLTQRDEYSSEAGMGNLVGKFNSTLKVSSSGSSDDHPEGNAVDGDEKTYWASLLFPDDGMHSTTFTIDFGKMVHASRVTIDWEYQPLSYSIEASSDNITFQEVVRNFSNSAHYTTDAFPGTDFRVMRVVMLKPHYLYGVVSGGYVYGIRDIAVLTNNLVTVVGDCRAAANSDDARDKYFVSYVSGFEPLLSRKISSMENDLHSVISEISNEMNNLRESMDESVNCMDEKKDYEGHISSIVSKEQSLWKLFNAATITRCQYCEDDLSILGENTSNPAEDCYAIRHSLGSIGGKSGFYWIQPPCSTHPLRVYCDMASVSSMFIWNGRDGTSPVGLGGIRSPSSLRLQCASYGLEPFVVKSRHQVDEIKNAMHLMNFGKKLDSYVPLAYRFGSENKYRDFLNLFSFISMPTPSATADGGDDIDTGMEGDLHLNAVGLSMATSEIETFDLETSEIAAIVCSTNNAGDIVTPVELECTDVFGRSKKVYGSPNTNVLVRCSQDCSQVESLHVYGTDGLYSDHSSICLAAVHSGVIASKGTFVISIENRLKYYEGSKRNGVQSLFYNKSWHGLKDIIKEKQDELEHNGPDCKYSIRILPVEKRCPVVEAKGSFLQLPSSGSNLAVASKADAIAVNSATNGGDKEALDAPGTGNEVLEVSNKYDPNTVKFANKVIEIMDSIYGVDNKSVTNVVEQIAIVVSQAKKRLRTLEPIHNKQNESITSMFDSGEVLSSKVVSLHDTLESSKTLFENLLEDENEKNVDVAGDFTLDCTKMKFSKTFMVYDSSMTNGKSNWGYSNSPIEGHESYLVQTGDLDSDIIAEGSYAFLRNYKYFDFEFTCELMANAGGTVGVAFRAHDQFNYYLFEMSYEGSEKKLLKVEDGVPAVLATNPDQGYEPLKWYRIRVVCQYYYITVYCDEKLIFRVIDTSFLYGYFGLYSRGANSAFHFDKLSIKTKDVQHLTSPLRSDRLLHMKCCNYSESFSGDFSENYFVINPQYSNITTWSYQNLFNGEHRVIHQVKPAVDPLDVGSIAILRHDRYCRSGYFRFRVLPQCEAGTVGAVVHFKDRRNMLLVEMNREELRVRLLEGGEAQELGKVESKLAISKWNVVEVELGLEEVKVKLKANVPHDFLPKGVLATHDYTLSVKIPEGSYIRRGGASPSSPFGFLQVGSSSASKSTTDGESFWEGAAMIGLGLGLKSSACTSCYFDNVHVSPDSVKELNTNLIALNSSAWAACMSVDFLKRKTLCRKMSRDFHDRCMSDFCEHCCSHHTKLLNEHVKSRCLHSCRKNNALFAVNSKKFMVYLDSCTGLQGPAFDHCKGDRVCLEQSCRLCCNSGHYTEFDSLKRVTESTYCENKCKIPF